MTVKQHLKLFGVLKGVSSEDMEVVIGDMVAEVGLREKMNTRACELSGGMKRKLCLAIALIGDSKVVFLGKEYVGCGTNQRKGCLSPLNLNVCLLLPQMSRLVVWTLTVEGAPGRSWRRIRREG